MRYLHSFHAVLTALLCAVGVAFLAITTTAARAADTPKVQVTGDLHVGGTVTLTIDGPQASETGEVNPFRDYSVMVYFMLGPDVDPNIDAPRRWFPGKASYLVPGYFAADGNAAESGADRGNKWRVHFVPDNAGKWTFQVFFRTEKDAALKLKKESAKDSGNLDRRITGNLEIKAAPDGNRGILRYVDQAMPGWHVSEKDAKKFADSFPKFAVTSNSSRYLRWDDGTYFLKAGADSPENFLGYVDFDGTYRIGKLDKRRGENFAENLHKYEPHVRDWKQGDPTWQGGKGKGIIGALNYLASVGGNSVYFLTMNVGGDGKDVWPWISHEAKDRDRFDCSKLDQWNIVFDHMDKLGIQLHVVTQEQENDQLLDGGELGDTRKLYYRELIARFAHHRAVVWNLGEENTNTDAQRKAFSDYIRSLDPYDHPVVCHTFPGKYDEVYTPLLGHATFEGPSLQTNDTHRQTLKWIGKSVEAGRPWMVCLDEIGPAHTGVKPDADDPTHDEVRYRHLWGNLMAGGAGVEWYFGYKYAHNDLNCEDWRSRAEMWRQTNLAVTFFQQHLPFTQMHPADGLTAAGDDYVFIKPGEVYCVYVPRVSGSREVTIDLPEAAYAVKWFNPRKGGELADGSVKQMRGGGAVSVGAPPAGDDGDWVALITLKGDAPKQLSEAHTKPQW